MWLQELYFILLTVLAVYIAANTLINLIYRLRLPNGSTTKEGKMVSVLIPARNEEANIGSCLESLTRQSYKNLEILVLDDESEDNTWNIIGSYARKYGNVRIFKGKPKPAGWKGKAWALEQLSRHARGDYLYMTDSDTVHSPEAVAWAAETLEKRGIDAFSAMPRQRTRSFSEKLLVPMIYLPFLLIPLPVLNAGFMRRISVGIGQFFFFKKDVFFGLGGMHRVRDKISEDVAMSKLLKKEGYRYHFLDARGLTECKMYGGLQESVTGLTKNLYDIASFSPALTAVFTAVLLGFFTAPLLIALGTAVSSVWMPLSLGSTWLFVSVGLFTLSWMVHMAYYRTKAGIILLYPLFFLSLAVLFAVSIYNYLTGRPPVWKARALTAS